VPSSQIVDLASRFGTVALLVEHSRDVLDARPSGGDPPAALVSRGWAGFLESLSDASLERLEIEGLAADWPSDMPASLGELVRAAREICAVPELDRSQPTGRPQRKLETPRKSAQVDAFAPLVLPYARRATRVLDVGSGHGHLGRELAQRIALPVVGLERDRRIAERARSLPGQVSFAELDVLRDGLPVQEGDCVIGLHACGELGDAIVQSAAEHRASVALVGCCLQKRRDSARAPLSIDSRTEDALVLPTRLLGLSNLTAREEGVEATREENLRARERRLALHRLLSERVGPLRFGAEIDGLNRRTAHASLDTLVERAFAHRRLPLPSAIDRAAAASWAHQAHARARRLSLPRTMLARVLEVFVLCDRARFLEQRGFTVELGTVFPASLSARNLGLFAAPSR